MSGVAQKDGKSANAQTIPTRTVVLNDPSQMPSVYSQTPGGTLFSTTPGGNSCYQYVNWFDIYIVQSFFSTLYIQAHL